MQVATGCDVLAQPNISLAQKANSSSRQLELRDFRDHAKVKDCRRSFGRAVPKTVAAKQDEKSKCTTEHARCRVDVSIMNYDPSTANSVFISG